MQVSSEAGNLVVQNKSDKNQTVAVDLSSSINILANRNTVIILYVMLKGLSYEIDFENVDKNW